MPLDDFYNKIRALESFNIEAVAISIITENSEIILDMLRDQLSRGLDGDDKAVTIFGSPFYKDITVWSKTFHGKDALAKETGYITNYMTGKFYNELYVRINGKSFTISSSVEYFSDIILRSGIKIMELNKAHLQEFSEGILIPQIRERFITHINGI